MPLLAGMPETFVEGFHEVTAVMKMKYRTVPHLGCVPLPRLPLVPWARSLCVCACVCIHPHRQQSIGALLRRLGVCWNAQRQLGGGGE